MSPRDLLLLLPPGVVALSLACLPGAVTAEAETRLAAVPSAEWSTPDEPAPLDVASPRIRAAPPRPGNPLWAIPLGSLRESRERPIFLPSRRRPVPAVSGPPRASAPAPAVAAAPPTLALVGVIANETDSIGIFRDTLTNDHIRLRPGEAHQSWLLRELRRSEAIFEGADESSVVISLPRPLAAPR